MENKPYRVHVVVDVHYGDRLRSLPKGEPSWVVASPVNQPVIREIWKEYNTTDDIEGITSFNADPKATPEDWLVSELDMIDLHHGELSNDPPYSVLRVVGVSLSERIKKALSEFGLTATGITSDGFEARRGQDNKQVDGVRP